jgi:hypothetical protein
MSSTQQLLFDGGDLPEKPANRALVIRPTSTRPLTGPERAFNRALAKVERLRARLEEEKRWLDRALVFHAAEVRPRRERAVELRARLVRALAPFLDDKRLKARDRQVLRAILAEQLDDVLAHVGAPDPELQTLFARLHDLAYTDAVQKDMDLVRSEMAAMFEEFGMDGEVPELRANMSEEEMAAFAAQLADRVVQGGQAPDVEAGGRRKTRREQREAERLRQYEQMRKDSIGAVYRRLVKVLHPDLEGDAAEREKKNAVMQQVTAAYARNDLLTLLRFELDWIGGARTGSVPTSEEKLRSYVSLLNAQARELEAECRILRLHPRYAELTVDGPIGFPVLIDGPGEAARLDEVIEFLRAALERLASEPLQEIRGAVQEYRAAHQARRRRPGR